MKIQVCLHVHAHACVHACLPGLIRNACLASRSLEAKGAAGDEGGQVETPFPPYIQDARLATAYRSAGKK